jgi:hypothetical protein
MSGTHGWVSSRRDAVLAAAEVLSRNTPADFTTVFRQAGNADLSNRANDGVLVFKSVADDNSKCHGKTQPASLRRRTAQTDTACRGTQAPMGNGDRPLRLDRHDTK